MEKDRGMDKDEAMELEVELKPEDRLLSPITIKKSVGKQETVVPDKPCSTSERSGSDKNEFRQPRKVGASSSRKHSRDRSQGSARSRGSDRSQGSSDPPRKRESRQGGQNQRGERYGTYTEHSQERRTRRDQERRANRTRRTPPKDRTPSPAVAPKFLPSMVFVPSRDRSRSQMERRNAKEMNDIRPGEESIAVSSTVKRIENRNVQNPVFGRLGPPPGAFGNEKQGGRDDSGYESLSASLTAQKGEAVARPFAVQAIHGLIIPNRFKINPSLGKRCYVCGKDAADRHREAKDCPQFKAKVSEFGQKPKAMATSMHLQILPFPSNTQVPCFALASTGAALSARCVDIQENSVRKDCPI